MPEAGADTAPDPVHPGASSWVAEALAFLALAGPMIVSRLGVAAACERSLNRLKTDRIDLYQSHDDDAGTPLDETSRPAMSDWRGRNADALAAGPQAQCQRGGDPGQREPMQESVATGGDDRPAAGRPDRRRSPDDRRAADGVIRA